MKLVLLILLSILASCVPDMDRSALNFSMKKLPELQRDKETVTFEELKTLVLARDNNCTSCHRHREILDDEELFEEKWVDKENPLESKLYKSVKEGWMPKGKPPLPTSDLEIIEAYLRKFSQE